MGSSWIRDQTWQADSSPLSYQGSPRQLFYSLTWIPSMLKLEVISMQVHWSLYILQTRRQRCCLMSSFILGSILNWLSNQNLLDQSNHSHSCSIPVTFKYPFSQPSHCPSHPTPTPQKALPFPWSQENGCWWVSGKKMRELFVMSALGPVVQWHLYRKQHWHFKYQAFVTWSPQIIADNKESWTHKSRWATARVGSLSANFCLLKEEDRRQNGSPLWEYMPVVLGITHSS